MFKKFLSRFFKPRQPHPQPQARPELTRHQPAASNKNKGAKQNQAAAPAAKAEWEKQAARRIDPRASPEQLCGITPDMTPDEISERLAILYRRHNRATSSLEANLREEAEIMLSVIASMRQKYLK